MEWENQMNKDAGPSAGNTEEYDDSKVFLINLITLKSVISVKQTASHRVNTDMWSLFCSDHLHFGGDYFDYMQNNKR